jgi:hypothetical protein
MDEDFLDIITNPLNSAQDINARWEQVRNDPLLGGARTNSVTATRMPVWDTESSALLKDIRMDIDPNAGKPSILRTPIHIPQKSILFTPDQREDWEELSRLPGFAPSMVKTWQESFPDQSGVIADMDMSILYKKIDLNYGKLSKEHFDHDLQYIHDKKYEGSKITELDPAVVDRMKELIITDASGIIKGIHNTQDRHIVHQVTDGAKELFDELGLDIHAPENRITLPSDIKLTENEITEMTQHVGRHDDVAFKKIEAKVKDIQTALREGEISKLKAKEKLLDFIQKQRNELESGEQLLNSVGRKR